jgi:hypothetical protein
VIGQMRCRRHHAPGVARRADAAALARERYRQVVAARIAIDAGKTVGEDAALQVAAELALDVGGYRVSVARAGECEPGRQVGLHGAVEQAALRPPPPVGRRAVVRRRAPTRYHGCPSAPRCGVGAQGGRHRVPGAIGHPD